MSELKHPPFVAWEEHIICHERGSRVVHFYLRDASGDLALAVIGTEPSIRHMMYIVPDNFLQAYGSEIIINGCTKWRARREVVEWLTWLVSQHNQPLDCSNAQMNDSIQALGSLKLSVTGSSCRQTPLPDQMVPRKLKVQNSDIVWSGLAWICAKQLEHYPAFCRNGATIAVHSFVFIMAEKESRYVGYLEDLYQDKKGQKKVKVRWFHHNQEVNGVFSQLNPHPREVFITPHVQVISAECIDGFATVLTPKHYEKCLAILPHTLSSGVYMCFRQLRNNKVKPFTLNKLRGYSYQAILSHLNTAPDSKQKVKCRKLNEQEGVEFSQQDSVRPNAKRSRSRKKHHKLGTSDVTITNSTPGNQITKREPTYPKLKFRLSRTPAGMNVVGPKPQFPLSLKFNDEVEFFCQDSGIRGCWFRCKVLGTSQKNLKVQYDDLQNVDGSGNLEEWVPASRVAPLDKHGMRCPGRLTIRPRPPESFKGCLFTVGTPVDAWWSDGWWEGVVTGIDSSGNDNLQVFFPGENMSLNFQKADVRTSRDWVDNTWVDLKAKPDILSGISKIVSPSMKLPLCSAVAWEPERGGSAHLDHNVPSNSRLEVVEEVEDKECCLVTKYSLLNNVNGVNIGKGPLISSKDDENKCGGGGDDDDNAGTENKSIMEENIVSSNKKYEAAETVSSGCIGFMN